MLAPQFHELCRRLYAETMRGVKRGDGADEIDLAYVRRLFMTSGYMSLRNAGKEATCGTYVLALFIFSIDNCMALGPCVVWQQVGSMLLQAARTCIGVIPTSLLPFPLSGNTYEPMCAVCCRSVARKPAVLAAGSVVPGAAAAGCGVSRAGRAVAAGSAGDGVCAAVSVDGDQSAVGPAVGRAKRLPAIGAATLCATCHCALHYGRCSEAHAHSGCVATPVEAVSKVLPLVAAVLMCGNPACGNIVREDRPAEWKLPCSHLFCSQSCLAAPTIGLAGCVRTTNKCSRCRSVVFSSIEKVAEREQLLIGRRIRERKSDVLRRMHAQRAACEREAGLLTGGVPSDGQAEEPHPGCCRDGPRDAEASSDDDSDCGSGDDDDDSDGGSGDDEDGEDADAVEEGDDALREGIASDSDSDTEEAVAAAADSASATASRCSGYAARRQQAATAQGFDPAEVSAAAAADTARLRTQTAARSSNSRDFCARVRVFKA